MNATLPVLLLAALPLCALATELTAPDDFPGKPENKAPWAPHRDRPGREQVAMRMMIRHLLLDRYDADGDSRLDSEERHRLMEDAHAARKQQALAIIRRFDADGDGKLSTDERTDMQQAMAERHRAETPPAAADSAAGTPPPAPPHHSIGRRGSPRENQHRPHPHMGKDGHLIALLTRQLTMEAYDADKNGILDTTESARLREDGAAAYAAREAELLSLYDTDKDGTLSESEFQIARKTLFPHPQRVRRAEGEKPLPPPHHRRGHGRGSIQHLLDTHFDIDILFNLAHPQGETGSTPPPCAPSTPTQN